MANTFQTVTVESLPVITHEDVRVITTELLANLYGTEPKNLRMNFANNEDRFVSGKHFFKLEGEPLREFKSLHKANDVGFVEISPRAKHLTLWTERGAARHAKMLDTDEAWEVFEKLEDCYFGVGKDHPTTAFPTYQRALVTIEHGKITSILDLEGCSLVETKGLWTVRENLRIVIDQLSWLQGEASGEALERRLKPLG